MTVKQLIEILKSMPKDAEVAVNDGNLGYLTKAERVRQINARYDGMGGCFLTAQTGPIVVAIE